MKRGHRRRASRRNARRAEAGREERSAGDARDADGTRGDDREALEQLEASIRSSVKEAHARRFRAKRMKTTRTSDGEVTRARGEGDAREDTSGVDRPTIRPAARTREVCRNSSSFIFIKCAHTLSPPATDDSVSTTTTGAGPG